MSDITNTLTYKKIKDVYLFERRKKKLSQNSFKFRILMFSREFDSKVHAVCRVYYHGAMIAVKQLSSKSKQGNR